MSNRKQRRHQGKPQGMTYADQLARKRLIEQAAQSAANDTMVKIRTEAEKQKAYWIFMVSVNRCFKVGKVGFERLSEVIFDVTEWYEKIAVEDGEDVANEKLHQEVERATRQKVDFVWEDALIEAAKRRENAAYTRFERLRMSRLEKMAETLCDMVGCDRCPARHLCNHKDGKANGMVKWLNEEVRE